MKKLFALVLVLALVATLFVAAPANAAADIPNLLEATDETGTQFIPEVWNWGKNLSAFYFWTNDEPSMANPAEAYTFKSFNLSNPIQWMTNTVAGNRIIRLNKKFPKQYSLQLTTKPLAEGNYTFFFWIKGSNIVNENGNPATPTRGFLDVKVFSGSDQLNPGQSNAWWIVYQTIEAANADNDADAETNNGMNGIAEGSLGWTLVRTRFAVSEAQANQRCKIEFTFIGGVQGGTYDLDCMWVVAGNDVPSFDALYPNDLDRDGLKDDVDPDINGDGIPNVADKDGDGLVPDLDIDADGDGIPNKYDPDIDGDGIRNIFDKDMDDDGIPNGIDPLPMGLLN